MQVYKTSPFSCSAKWMVHTVCCRFIEPKAGSLQMACNILLIYVLKVDGVELGTNDMHSVSWFQKLV